MAKNYYIVLGLPSDASQKEIKSAYRQLVKELHPDHYRGDSAPFREIQEAYATLGDTEHRRAYDRQQRRRGSESSSASAWPEPVVSRSSPIEPVEPVARQPIEEVFVTNSFESYAPSLAEILDRLRRNFVAAERPKGERIESLNLEVPLTAEQARQGGYLRVMIPVHMDCPACRGHGGIGFFVCWRCGGHGLIDEEAPVRVPYPAGISGNHVVQIPLDRFGIDNFYLTLKFCVAG